MYPAGFFLKAFSSNDLRQAIECGLSLGLPFWAVACSSVQIGRKLGVCPREDA